MKNPIIAKSSSVILAASLLFFAMAFAACDSLKTSIYGYGPPVLEIVIKPDFEKIKGLSIGIFNFNNRDRSDKLGHAFAQFSQRHLLEHKFMEVVDLTGILSEGIQDAIEVGRNKGYDLILLGSVNEYYYGGLSADSKVSISIRIIDVRTEAVLGYVTGRMEGRYKERFDFIVYKKDSKEAPSPSLLGAKVMQEILNLVTEPPATPEEKDESLGPNSVSACLFCFI